MELPLDAHVQRKQLDVVERVVAVLCSCVVIRHIHPPLMDHPSHVVRPCAPDVAPPRYPTRMGRKRCASGLLGPRGAAGVSMGGDGGYPMA
jgi:hypothetical protein